MVFSGAVLLISGKGTGIHGTVSEGIGAHAFLDTGGEGTFVHIAVDVGVDALAVDGVMGEAAFVDIAVGIENPAFAFLQQVGVEFAFVDVTVGVGDLLSVQVYFGGDTVGIDDPAFIGCAFAVHQAQELDVHFIGDLDGDIPDTGEVDGGKDTHEAHGGADHDGEHDRAETAAVVGFPLFLTGGSVGLHGVYFFLLILIYVLRTVTVGKVSPISYSLQ